MSSKVTPINRSELVQEQACQWISSMDRGLSDLEKQEIRGWIGQSDLHRAKLFEMAALWDDLSVMHELSGMFPLADPQTTSAGTGFNKRASWIFASAACFLCVMFLFLMSPFAPEQMQSQKLVASTEIQYDTKVGEQKVVTLDDGSVLALNTNTSVSVNFSEDTRLVQVHNGEAHFEVASAANRPFVVKAGDSQVVAIGTAFNVQLLPSERLELLVTEGKVLVSDRKRPLPDNIAQLKSQDFSAIGTLMVSGDTGIFKGEHSESSGRLSLDQVQRNLSWQQGMLVFQGESLQDALDEMARYTDMSFSIEDESLKSLRVAGYFKVGDTDGLLQSLHHNFEIESRTVGSIVYLEMVPAI